MPRARALALQVLREILLAVAAYYAYNIAKNLIHPDPATDAFRNAWNVVSLERVLAFSMRTLSSGGSWKMQKAWSSSLTGSTPWASGPLWESRAYCFS